MTESEALEWLKGFYNGDCEREDFEDTICADCNFPFRHGKPILRAISSLEEIQQYRAIGTVSEFRELKEKATAKSPAYQGEHEKCPTCGSFCIGEYCIKCGQRILCD